MAMDRGWPVVVADTEAEATGHPEGTTYYAKNTEALLCQTSGDVKNILANALIDAAPAGAGGVPIRAAATIIGIGGAPIAGDWLTGYQNGGTGQMRCDFLNNTARIQFLTIGPASRGEIGERVAGTFGLGSVASIPTILYSNSVERLRIAAAAAEVGIGLSPIVNYRLSLLHGASVASAKAGGIIDAQTTGVGTDADTLEKDLLTFSLPANSLDLNGKAVRVTAWGTTSANADTKRVRLYFGGTTILDSTALALNDRVWVLDAVIARTGAATQDAMARWNAQAQSVGCEFTTPTETLSGAVIVKVTGQNGVATANDLVCQGMTIEALGA